MDLQGGERERVKKKINKIKKKKKKKHVYSIRLPTIYNITTQFFFQWQLLSLKLFNSRSMKNFTQDIRSAEILEEIKFHNLVNGALYMFLTFTIFLIFSGIIMFKRYYLFSCNFSLSHLFFFIIDKIVILSLWSSSATTKNGNFLIMKP